MKRRLSTTRVRLVPGRAASLAAAVGLLAVGIAGGLEWGRSGTGTRVAGAQAPALPTSSGPVAITSDDQFVWSVNPDNNSVSLFNVLNDANQKLAEVPVGENPWCVAITPDNAKVYVTNQGSGTISVIDAASRTVVRTIELSGRASDFGPTFDGGEPFGCALKPDGTRLFVALFSAESVFVINTANDRVFARITRGLEGTKPRSLAITADGDQGLRDAVPLRSARARRDASPDPDRGGRRRPSRARDGDRRRPQSGDQDDHPEPDRREVLPVRREHARPRAADRRVFDNPTKAFPNLLEAVVIKGNRAYVPGTCSSPNGPFRFNVNVQSCLSAIDTDAGRRGVPDAQHERGCQLRAGRRDGCSTPTRSPSRSSGRRPRGSWPWPRPTGSCASTLDAQGMPTINPPAAALPRDPRQHHSDPAQGSEPRSSQPDPDDTIGGKNPRGIVLNSTDTRAYVMDFVSRDVAVVDISGRNPALYKTLARIPSADLPADALDAIVQRGKQLFNSAIGPEGEADNSRRPAGRMSDFGWGTCYSCHPQALTDSVTWMFADGPRQAISMESTFTVGQAVIGRTARPVLPDSHQRALNWSAVRDEVQDFTRNIRAVSGGGGLIRVDANGNPVPEGVAGLAQLPDLRPTANTGLNADLDAIATYLALGVRRPISPVRKLGVNAGRGFFRSAGCESCHGGPNWTSSILDYTPPPDAGEIVDAQLIRFLCRVGTFDPNLFTDGVSNEIRANNANNVQARGADGFNVPSLIAVFASAPYLHSGAAPTLDAVLENVTHRSAGSGGVDTLQAPSAREQLVRFLKSIDRETQPFAAGTPPAQFCGPVTP